MANLAARLLPTSARSVGERLSNLESAVRFLASSRDRIGRATIEVGRDFLIKGLLKVVGEVSLVSEDGEELLRMGDLGFGRGIELKRDDGSTALRFGKPFSSTDQQLLELLDRSGHAFVSQELLGPGLGRPCLQLPLQPIYPASGTPVLGGPYGIERSTTSGTFETLFAYDGRAQNLLLDFKFMATCSNGTTAGEIQIVDLDTGLPLVGFFAPPWVGVIPAGTTTMTVFDPGATAVLSTVSSVGMAGQMRLGVQVRRTAGAGTITLAVPQAMGG